MTDETKSKETDMSRGQSGFSLIEVMIVVVILGMLVAVLAPKIMDKPDEARVTKAGMDIRQLEFALKLYKLDNSKYPTTDQGLMALIEKPDLTPIPKNYKDDGYLDGETSPVDPWGNEYIYRSPGDGKRKYEIISLGADGEEGGEGNDADINSWELSQ